MTPRQTLRRTAVLAASALFLLGALRWDVMLRAAARFLVVDDGPRSGDAVVVLSGDPSGKRLATGLVSLLEGRGRVLIVLTEGALSDRTTEVIHHVADLRGVAAGRVIVVGGVSSTREDARLAAEVMEGHGWHTAIVVTSPYHTRRASWVFHRAWTPLGLSAFVQPSTDPAWTPDRWWREPGTARSVASEYAKFVAYGVLFAIHHQREGDTCVP